MLLAMAKDIRVILDQARRSPRTTCARSSHAAEKQERIAQETMEIYAPLANRLGIHWMKSELEDLAFR